MTNEQFRALEDISGHRSPSNSKAGSSKADDLLAAAISAFAGITRPGRQDMQQLEDLAMPLLHCASTRGKRHAANALAQLEDAPRRLILALADEPVEISAPILLRSPFYALPTSSKSSARTVLPMRAPLHGASPVTSFCKACCAVSPTRSSTVR